MAARGIDLPTLGLVIHVELPRDAETLQHRSGRTGRAGKKGTAVLVVPYPRRRKVESMLRGARIAAEWVPVPTPEMIREKDRERLLTTLLAPQEMDEEDRALGERLLAEQEPAVIAAALVRAHRGAMPVPEELLDAGAPAERPARGDMGDGVWFRLNAGRRQNADPRWILPLLCRLGHIARGDVGAIRVDQHETRFEIAPGSADRFAAAVARNADADSGIEIVRAGAPASGRSGGGRPHRGSARRPRK